MEAFGVCFAFEDSARFETLRVLFNEVKHDKDTGKFRDAVKWILLVPDELKHGFEWPTTEAREHWLAVKGSKIILISEPNRQIGRRWDFFRVFEAIEEGDYSLLWCRAVGDGVAEMRIDPNGYPYGGVGPLIALAEAFGFVVLGVNECGRYETRQELLDD